jgi:hypothetical protein
MLLGASGVLIASYAFSPFWDGGGSYGSRYISETMPVLSYFLNCLPALQRKGPERRGLDSKTVIFVVCVAIGVFNQLSAIVGGHKALSAYVNTPIATNDAPEDRRWAYMHEAPLKTFQTRRWNLLDGLNERIWRGLYYNNYVMPQTNATFVKHAGCNASIVSVEDSIGRGVGEFRFQSVEGERPHGDKLLELFSAGRKYVHARIHNDGTVPLYGYQTGLTWGYAGVSHKVTDGNGVVVYQNGTVYVSGIINPGETGDAFGSMEFVVTKGHYSIEGQVSISGIGFCGPPRQLGTIMVE